MEGVGGSSPSVSTIVAVVGESRGFGPLVLLFLCLDGFGDSFSNNIFVAAYPQGAVDKTRFRVEYCG